MPRSSATSGADVRDGPPVRAALCVVGGMCVCVCVCFECICVQIVYVLFIFSFSFHSLALSTGRFAAALDSRGERRRATTTLCSHR